jgi:imidazoleglycerol-phosphate dehydratase
LPGWVTLKMRDLFSWVSIHLSAVGDYYAGPNHILPTGGTARFYSPVTVDTFLKKSGVLFYSQRGLAQASDDIITLAEVEGLTAHANSVRVRKEDQAVSDDIRSAEIHRKTNETEILLQLELDGTGVYQIDIEVPFLGHMLSLLAMHSLTNVKVWARGDTEVDFHHTVEDMGLSLGAALQEALGEKKGLNRYGCAMVPMDEALVRVVVDLSGRPCLMYNVPIPVEMIGTFLRRIGRRIFSSGGEFGGYDPAYRSDTGFQQSPYC